MTRRAPRSQFSLPVTMGALNQCTHDRFCDALGGCERLDDARKMLPCKQLGETLGPARAMRWEVV